MKISHLILQLGGAGVLACSGTQAFAESYTVIVPASNSELVAFSFCATNLNRFLSGVPGDTVVQAWNVATTNYIASLYYADVDEWYPDLTINPGEAFLITNPTGTNFTATLSGIPLTNSSYTITMQAGKTYMVGSAYMKNLSGGNFLECMDHMPTLYTPHSLNFPGANGDSVYLWDVDSWNGPEIRSTENGKKKWSGEGIGVSPTIALPYPNSTPYYGGACAIVPVSNRTWIQHHDPDTCQ